MIAAFDASGAGARKPLFAVWLGADAAMHRRFEASGIASFESESDAVRAVMDLVRCRRAAASLVATSAASTPRIVPDRAKASAAIAAALRDGRSWLSPVEAQDLMRAYGIASTPVAAAASPAEARAAARPFLADSLGCVVKIQSRDIVHKSDVDGVRLGLRSAEAVEQAARDILARAAQLSPDARIDGVTIQPMITRPHARELIIGVAIDPTFGPVILFGHGGTAVEVIDDKAMELLPIGLAEAKGMVSRTVSRACSPATGPCRPPTRTSSWSCSSGCRASSRTTRKSSGSTSTRCSRTRTTRCRSISGCRSRHA